MRFILFISVFLSLFGVSKVQAQEQQLIHGNLWLGPKSNGLEDMRIYVDANRELLIDFIESREGFYRHTFRGHHLVQLTSKYLPELLQQGWCKNVRIESGWGSPLMDSSKIHTNSIHAHNGSSKLPATYTGSGVIIGIIDSGIDMDHPDFQTDSGKTRVLKIWDQTRNTDTTRRPIGFGYGEVYSKAEIDAGNCPHSDPNQYHGHGTMVSGVAVSNGNSVHDSIADYAGHAPEADILFAAISFSSNSFTQDITDAVTWLFDEASAAGKPCVINISAGTYLGSHDGLDLQAQFIDSLIKAKEGRAVVCAAGNAGAVAPFHLRVDIKSDTAFTWFKANPSSGLGQNAVFFEVWADKAQFDSLEFGVAVTDTATLVDTIVWSDFISNRLDTLIVLNALGSTFMTWAEQRGSRYLLQVVVTSPKASRYHAFFGEGSGSYDIWSSAWLGLSDMMYENLPQHSHLAKYAYPDTLQSIVSLWACSPHVLTVANFNNRSEYENVAGGKRIFSNITTGALASTSSSGPNRLGHLKPDLAAPGNVSVTSGRLVDLAYLNNTPSQRYKLAKGGFHFSNGGTSMASPVVSGIVAMMLEKCPKLTHYDIISHLKQAAYRDSFTGSQPNYNFGFGKVDAVAALEVTNINEKIMTGNGASYFCEGDSLRLSTSQAFAKVLWSTGDLGQSSYVSKTDTVFAQIENAKGCREHTDTLVIKEEALPRGTLVFDSSKVEFCEGEQVTISINPTHYQMRWSNGSTDSVLVVNQSDTVYVTLTDSLGCVNETDRLVIVEHPAPMVSINGDSVICIGDTAVLTGKGAAAYRWSSGDSISQISISSGGEYQLHGTDTNQCVDSAIFTVIEQDCYVGISELKKEGIRVWPNPSRGLISIACRDDSFTKVSVLSFSGKVLQSQQSIDVSTNYKLDLPNGSYLLKIETMSGTSFHQIKLIR